MRFSLFGENRRDDHDPLLALFDLPSEVVPGVVSGDPRGGRPLGLDQKYVVPAVTMKTAHRGEVLLKNLAVSRLERGFEAAQRLIGDLSYSFFSHRASVSFCGTPRVPEQPVRREETATDCPNRDVLVPRDLTHGTPVQVAINQKPPGVVRNAVERLTDERAKLVLFEPREMAVRFGVAPRVQPLHRYSTTS